MSGIFDKLKQGAQDAGKKAQVSVEISKLKSQITNKETEIQQTELIVGKLVYDSFEKDSFSENEQKIFSLCKTISGYKKEIQDMENRILILKDEKFCTVCNTVTNLSTKFCSHCGNGF